MDDKKLFRISDVAKMFRVSTGTLRHYEKAGLLCPEHYRSGGQGIAIIVYGNLRC